jgi:branched-chain amino acid aminotransferase
VIHQYVLHNGEICEADRALLSPGQIGLLSGWGVFSTIRVVRGVLFAWERHWARMKHDAELLHVPFPASEAEVHAALLRLVEANRAYDATLRVVVVRNRGGIWEGPGQQRDYDLIALTTQPKDWGAGARLTVVPQARHSAQMFAGAKTLSWSMNLCWYEMAQQKGFDEALLLNEKGNVSECTSANIFIASGSEVWTPPLSSGCLPGVTRDVLLHEVHVEGIRLVERDFGLGELYAAGEVFITSTTRNLLPVLEVDGTRVGGASAVRERLSQAFADYVERYAGAAAGVKR